MAAGDITRDTGSPTIVGNRRLLQGTIEVDDTPRTFALMDTKSRITSCQMVDEDGVGSASVALNVNSSGTATNGSLAVFGNHNSVETYRYECLFV